MQVSAQIPIPEASTLTHRNVTRSLPFPLDYVVVLQPPSVLNRAKREWSVVSRIALGRVCNRLYVISTGLPKLSLPKTLRWFTAGMDAKDKARAEI